MQFLFLGEYKTFFSSSTSNTHNAFGIFRYRAAQKLFQLFLSRLVTSKYFKLRPELHLTVSAQYRPSQRLRLHVPILRNLFKEKVESKPVKQKAFISEHIQDMNSYSHIKSYSITHLSSRTVQCPKSCPGASWKPTHEEPGVTRTSM